MSPLELLEACTFSISQLFTPLLSKFSLPLMPIVTYAAESGGIFWDLHLPESANVSDAIKQASDTLNQPIDDLCLQLYGISLAKDQLLDSAGARPGDVLTFYRQSGAAIPPANVAAATATQPAAAARAAVDRSPSRPLSTTSDTAQSDVYKEHFNLNCTMDELADHKYWGEWDAVPLCRRCGSEAVMLATPGMHPSGEAVPLRDMPVLCWSTMFATCMGCKYAGPIAVGIIRNREHVDEDDPDKLPARDYAVVWNGDIDALNSLVRNWPTSLEEPDDAEELDTPGLCRRPPSPMYVS